jgi:hypothetical protein
VIFFLGYCGSEIPYSIFLDSYSMRVAVRPFWASALIPQLTSGWFGVTRRSPQPFW